MQHFCFYMFSANYHELCIYAWHVIIYAKTKFHTQQLGNIYTPPPNWNPGYAPATVVVKLPEQTYNSSKIMRLNSSGDSRLLQWARGELYCAWQHWISFFVYIVLHRRLRKSTVLLYYFRRPIREFMHNAVFSSFAKFRCIVDWNRRLEKKNVSFNVFHNVSSFFTRPDSLCFRRFINHLLTYLLTFHNKAKLQKYPTA